MPNYLPTIQKEPNLNLQTLKDDILARKDKNFFRPTGTQIYVGRQGSGKTVSAVHHLNKLMIRYPKAKIVTNLNLNIDRDYYKFSTIDELASLLVKVNNEHYGVIYLIDEIHTYFNSLDSKNIPMFVFTEISQQRKQRKLIIGTSQLFTRAAKPLREQVDNVIVCKTYFGVLTTQQAYDGETLEEDYNGKTSGDKKKFGFFIQTRKTRSLFDTYQKVVSGLDSMEQIKKPMEIEMSGLLKKKITLKD